MNEFPDPSRILDTLDGTEFVRVSQQGKWRWVRTALLRLKGDPGQDSKVPGPPGPPRRIEIYSGAGDVTFSTPFAAVPIVLPVVTYAGNQQVTAVASEITAKGCKLTVMVSRGTLLLNQGPFEPAKPGIVGTVVAIGN